MGNAYHPDIVFMYDGEYIDPELKQYLGSIVVRLNEVSHRSEMSVDFTVLNTSMINAFAIPGHVYATRGFLAELQNEAQFAAVMGHELAHVEAPARPGQRPDRPGPSGRARGNPRRRHPFAR